MIYIMTYLQEWEMRRAMNRSRIRNTQEGGWAWVPGLLRCDCYFDLDFDDGWGGGSDQENFWLICPVLPDSDQLYFNFHLPQKITKICFLVAFCIYKYTNTTKNSNLTCLTTGALVDFVQMPNFWRHLQSTPDQIWLWSILTKGGWLWQCWVWFWWSAQVADAGRRCSDYRGDKPWVRYTTS